MSLFTRFSACRFLFFVSVVIVALSSPLRAQDSIVNWKPSVGDKFTYLHSHSELDKFHTGQSYQDTLSYSITIAKDSSFAAGDENFLFWSTKDSCSFQILEAVESFATPFTFCIPSNSNSRISFQGQSLSLFSSQADFIPLLGSGIPDGNYHSDIEYSPELRWFYSKTENDTLLGFHAQPDYIQDTLILISATLQSASVVNNPSELFNVNLMEGTITISFVSLNKSAEIDLLDQLGRFIRLWRLPVEAGERDISLNVADVPSGVYFLRVSGEGIDAVRKVYIAH